MNTNMTGILGQETRHALPSPPSGFLPPCAVAQTDVASLSLANLRFLVAEDHDFQRETIIKLLRRLGALVVYGARDGTSALRALADPAHPVDILVLDMAMPGMDGVELIQTLGSSKAAVAVILSSAFDAEFLEGIKLMADGYDANVLGIAAKPLTAAKLRPLMNVYMANNHRADAT